MNVQAIRLRKARFLRIVRLLFSVGDDMSAEETTKATGWSGHRYFTVDDLAAMQPGLARIMPEVGQRYWKLYYAAKAGNWALAKFQSGEIKELMEMGLITRPKYEEHLDAFISQNLSAIDAAIQNQDWAAFDEAFHQGVKDANDYHKLNNKGFLIWKLPDHEPPDLDMTPLEE